MNKNALIEKVINPLLTSTSKIDGNYKIELINAKCINEDGELAFQKFSETLRGFSKSTLKDTETCEKENCNLEQNIVLKALMKVSKALYSPEIEKVLAEYKPLFKEKYYTNDEGLLTKVSITLRMKHSKDPVILKTDDFFPIKLKFMNALDVVVENLGLDNIGEFSDTYKLVSWYKTNIEIPLNAELSHEICGGWPTEILE